MITPFRCYLVQPLLLLPGLLCDAALWRHQVATLGRIADCAVSDMTRDDTMQGMAERVLAAAPERFSLCGLSMGGYCALEIMRQAPERVERLALLDTSARPDPEERTRIRLSLIEQVEAGDFPEVAEQHFPLFLHPDHMSKGDLYGTIKRSAENVGKDAFVRQQHAIMSRRDSRPLLADITCPTLVLCGRQDELTPLECHEEMAAGIPGARLVVLEDCGHLAPLEQPEAINAALRDWLGS